MIGEQDEGVPCTVRGRVHFQWYVPSGFVLEDGLSTKPTDICGRLENGVKIRKGLKMAEKINFIKKEHKKTHKPMKYWTFFQY